MLESQLVTLDARGSEKQHQLKLSVAGQAGFWPAALNGSFDRAEQRWKGTLNNTRFDTPVGPNGAYAPYCAGLPQQQADNQHWAALLAQPECRAVRAADY